MTGEVDGLNGEDGLHGSHNQLPQGTREKP